MVEKEERHLFWLFTNQWMSLLSPWLLLYLTIILNLWCSPQFCSSSFPPLWHLYVFVFFNDPKSPHVWQRRTVLCVLTWVLCCHWLNLLHMCFFVHWTYDLLGFVTVVISSCCLCLFIMSIKITHWGDAGGLCTYFVSKTPVCGINDEPIWV